MLRSLAALGCGFLLAPAIFAQTFTSTDLAVVSAQVDKTALATGERFTFTARVRNHGPLVARDVNVGFGSGLTDAGEVFALSVEAPAGWSCRRSRYAAGVSCSTAAFDVFAEAEFRAVLLATAAVPPLPLTATVNVTSPTLDLQQANNRRSFQWTIAPAATAADLAVVVHAGDNALREGTPGSALIAVTNNGPGAVREVWLTIETDSTNAPPFTAEGAGWTCTAAGNSAVLCRAGTIVSGETLPVLLRFVAPREEGQFAFLARVRAEGNHDARPGNDTALGTVHVGSAANWKRILLPITATDIPGANGSLWKTDITMQLRDVGPQHIKPHPCDREIITCFGPPQNRPFDGSAFVLNRSVPGGQFLYIRAGMERRVSINIRIHDISRTAETAGAEIPIARDEHFRNELSLLGIPVAPEYRHTLRIYQLDAPPAPVRISVYAGGETRPRASVEQTPQPSPLLEPLTPALLPSHPSYLQLDLASLLPLAGIESVRIDIEPVLPDLQPPGTSPRIWAFVSIINNDTHHVTTVTPQ